MAVFFTKKKKNLFTYFFGLIKNVKIAQQNVQKSSDLNIVTCLMNN